MKKKNHTAILEFEVIAPVNELEIVGEKLTLLDNGKYYSPDLKREHNLLTLLDHPLHYRVSKVDMQGINYIIPKDREQNYIPSFHPETMKYYLSNKKLK